MITQEILYILDMIGVVSCAIAGSILAIRKGLDVFGIMLIATVSAIGGGTIRDLLLNNHPIFWLTQYSYLTAILVSSLLTLLFYKRISFIEKPLRIFDAIGLSAFTIIGIEAAIFAGHSSFIAIIMGITTATFGGIIRDIICNEIPMVLRKEIYITASLVGGTIFLGLDYLGLSKELCYLISIPSIFIIRIFAIYKDLQLPRFNSNLPN